MYYRNYSIYLVLKGETMTIFVYSNDNMYIVFCSNEWEKLKSRIHLYLDAMYIFIHWSLTVLLIYVYSLSLVLNWEKKFWKRVKRDDYFRSQSDGYVSICLVFCGYIKDCTTVQCLLHNLKPKREKIFTNGIFTNWFCFNLFAYILSLFTFPFMKQNINISILRLLCCNRRALIIKSK